LRGAFVVVGAAADNRPSNAIAGSSLATFAAGCFWSAESAFEGLPGVLDVTSGYTGGTERNPTYRQVSSGATGHAEAVEVRFDPTRITFAQLLDRFWHEVDPFAAHQQFCDLGDQYRPAVFVHDAEQRHAALASRRHWEQQFGRPIVVAVEDAGHFYLAEAHHQDYAARHPLQYRYYRWACGRDARLRQIWGRPSVTAETGATGSTRGNGEAVTNGVS
jgi:peptide-methionine (S)-S-oxide reductase